MIKSDIRQLFSKFGEDGESYQEIVRHEHAEEALGRWTLLRSLDLAVGRGAPIYDKPSTPPPGPEPRGAEPELLNKIRPARVFRHDEFQGGSVQAPQPGLLDTRAAVHGVQPEPARGVPGGLAGTFARLKHRDHKAGAASVSVAQGEEAGNDKSRQQPLGSVFSRLVGGRHQGEGDFLWRGKR